MDIPRRLVRFSKPAITRKDTKKIAERVPLLLNLAKMGEHCLGVMNR